MRKSRLALTVVIILLVLAGGGYGAFWYVQANEAKHAIEQTIARINTPTPYLHYDDITVSGFPKDVVVEIHHPRLEARMDTLLKRLGENMSPAPDGSGQSDLRQALLNLPEWHEELRLDGKIRIMVNLLSNHYAMDFEGAYAGTSKVKDQVTEYLIEPGEGDRGCELSFNREGVNLFEAWDWQYLSGDPQAFLKDFRSAGCHTPGYRVLLKGSNVPLLESSVNLIHVETGAGTSGRSLDFHFKMADYQGTAQLDALLEHRWHLFYPDQPLPVSYRMAPLGKQLQEVVFRMEGWPEDGAIGLTHPLRLALDKFVYHSELMQFDARFLFANTPTGDGTDYQLNLAMQNTATEGAYNLIATHMQEQASLFYKEMSAQGLPSGAWDQERFVATAVELVPPLHQWGKATLTADLQGHGTKEQRMTFTLSNTGFNITPYGVTLQGKGEYQPASGLAVFPLGELTVDCRSCLQLVDDVTEWTGKAAPMMAMASGQKIVVTDWAQQAENFKRFLLALAPESGGVMTFRLISDQAGNVTVNGKPMMEVMQLYDQHVASKAPVNAPPVQSPPP